MGRPRYEKGEPTARDRILEAYWSMLARMPFEAIAVRGVSVEAGVNHNTFYRHFESMEDLAKEAFDDVVLTQVPKILLSGDVLTLSPSQQDAFGKARLYASSKSALLGGVLCDGLENTWLDAAGVNRDDLTDEQKLDCAVIFNGLVHALGSEDLDIYGDAISDMLSRPLGKGMLETLERIAKAGAASL